MLALVQPRGYGWPVTRWALTLALLLLAPSAALAREPIISYVDETGTFRLYDEETEAEINPPPAVPANFLGFRYGMSFDGRYIVFNDNPAPRKLHLLDRATGTEIPLPGIDVYTNPGALTVSNTGRIGFDDNGNGPALVYDSATGQFVDTGLAANNGHRQTRLSGDGLFLATTCNDSNCVDDLDMGADPYVQDLTTKLDTGFPERRRPRRGTSVHRRRRLASWLRQALRCPAAVRHLPVRPQRVASRGGRPGRRQRPPQG